MLSAGRSVYLFIIRGCSTFDCTFFSSHFLPVLHDCRKEESGCVKNKCSVNRNTFLQKSGLLHAIWPTKWKIGEKMHYLSHHNQNQLCIFSWKFRRKRTMEKQINRVKLAKRLMQNVILCSPSRILQPWQKRSCNEFLTSIRQINSFFFVWRRSILFWFSIVASCSDIIQCLFWMHSVLNYKTF